MLGRALLAALTLAACAHPGPRLVVLVVIDQLPSWLQLIGKGLPLYYAADALRKVIILNATLSNIMPDLIVLVVYTFLTMTLAIPLFERAMKR